MTKILQYHFNPPFRRVQGKIIRHNLQLPIWLRRKTQNYYFDGFCFKPSLAKERPLGFLCIVAEMSEINPEENDVIYLLTKTIQKEYYRFFYPKPTDCFKWALEQGNRFLNRQLKNNNINWLSKLDFTAFAIRQDLSINLAKIGNIQTLLFTNGEIFDLSQALSQEATPIKSFSNTIEGSVQDNDKILLVSQKLFETFDEEEIFRWLLPVKKTKDIKNVFKQKKDILRKSSGVCFLTLAKKKKMLPWFLPKIDKRLFSYQAENSWTTNSPGQQSRASTLQTILLFLILAALIFIGWRIF